ncbi:MAG: hypothetical protein QG646_435 [Euryarchaeota archaeon]|nr:hypothetical protein [Euryarchaeota archaeon]
MSNDNNNISFDPINEYIGKIIIVENNKRRFSARLIAIKDNELWFESKTKARWMQSRSEIQYLGLAKQVA